MDSAWLRRIDGTVRNLQFSKKTAPLVTLEYPEDQSLRVRNGRRGRGTGPTREGRGVRRLRGARLKVRASNVHPGPAHRGECRRRRRRRSGELRERRGAPPG